MEDVEALRRQIESLSAAREAAELEVFRVQSRLAALVEASDAAILSVSLGGVIETWNSAAEKLFGYRAAETVGHTMRMLAPPDHGMEVDPMLVRCARGERMSGIETIGRRKDGEDVQISVTLSPILDLAGEIQAFSVILQDMTERTSLRERLTAADRMASIGWLAAGVAHEINNPLAYVSASLRYLDTSLERLPKDEVAPALRGSLARFEQAVGDARDGVSRVAEIVRDLRAISRSSEEKRGPVDLRAAIDIAAKMSSIQVSDKARLVKDYGEIPRAFANEARLVQVFINLLVNAAQAIPEGAADRNEIRVVTRTDERGRAVVEVRDTGLGIPPEIKDRVFEPFFTTKPADIGTGMGLSICHGIISAHRGEITMESELGKGSVFRVTLPAHHDAAEALADVAKGAGEGARVERSSSAPPSRRGRLLIVDDEVKLGTAMQKELSGMHDVEFLASGREALDRLRGGARFDVILCDLAMPAMSGIALYKEIQTLAPDQAKRMIFLTGGAFTATAQSFLHEVGNVYLEKPFDLASLYAVVDEALS